MRIRQTLRLATPLLSSALLVGPCVAEEWPVEWPISEDRVLFYDCESFVPSSLAFSARFVPVPRYIRESFGPLADRYLQLSGRYCIDSRRPIAALPGFELILARVLDWVPSGVEQRSEDSFLLRDGKFLFTPTRLLPKEAYGAFLDAFHRGALDEDTVIEITRLFFELSGGCGDNLIDSREALAKATWECRGGEGAELPEGVEEGITAGLEWLQAMLPEDSRPRVDRVEGGFDVHLFASWGGFPVLEKWVVHFPEQGTLFDVEVQHVYGGPSEEDKEE